MTIPEIAYLLITTGMVLLTVRILRGDRAQRASRRWFGLVAVLLAIIAGNYAWRAWQMQGAGGWVAGTVIVNLSFCVLGAAYLAVQRKRPS